MEAERIPINWLPSVFDRRSSCLLSVGGSAVDRGG